MAANLLSIVVLTRDEEQNLPRLLESCRRLPADIFVVDSGSIDRTLELAEAAGCLVVRHEWITYAEQFNWALAHLPLTTPWVMRMDADERLTPELVEELKAKLPACPPEVTGWLVKRQVWFWGRWIRHGGYYPTWLLRVWRNGVGACESRWMDEHIVVGGGEVRGLDHDIIDENHKGLTFWTDKHNRYADREVLDLLGVSGPDVITGQAGRRRWAKQNFYLRAPLFVRALGYWFYRYFLRLGLLDGIPGLVFHTLQGFWYRFLVDAKLYEQRLRSRQR